MSWGRSPHSDYYIHIVNNFVFGFRTYCDFDFDSKATKFLTPSRSTVPHELRPPKDQHRGATLTLRDAPALLLNFTHL